MTTGKQTRKQGFAFRNGTQEAEGALFRSGCACSPKKGKQGESEIKFLSHFEKFFLPCRILEQGIL